jgi:hypothetical protein
MLDQSNVPDVNVLVDAGLVIATLAIAGAIALGARRARLGIYLLSALALLMLSVADVLARQDTLAVLRESDLAHGVSGIHNVGATQAVRAALVLMRIAPFAAGAAWALGLLVTARARQWGWLAAIAVVVLASALLNLYLYTAFVQPPQPGLASLTICPLDGDLCVFSPYASAAKQLAFYILPLLTPLVTLAYGIAGPQQKADA